MGYPMNIGEAAQAAGVTAKMIRHYEGLGLIPEASRTDAGYRQYTDREVTVLRFIRQSRSMGFSIRQIEQLLGLWADTRRQSSEVKDLARQHIAELERKVAEMTQMKASLEQIADRCRGDERTDCPILTKLSGDAAAQRTAVPAPAQPRASIRPLRAADRAAARQGQSQGHAGLAAWMHGVRQAGMAEYA